MRIKWRWPLFGTILPTNNTSTNPIYQFDTCTSYPTNLKVTDSYGCSDDTTIIVTVYCNPVAIINPVVAVCQGDISIFTQNAIQGDAPVNTYQWNMGGSGTYVPGFTSNSQNPQYIYDDCDIYTVTLTVTDSNGCTHDTTISVTVNCLPLVNFSSSIVY